MAASIISPSTSSVIKVMASIKWPRLHRALLSLQHRNRLFSSQSAAQSPQPEEPKETVDSSPISPVQDTQRDLRFQEALDHEDFFQLKNLVTMKELFQARAHLGHNSGLRHPTMTPFIFGERLGHDIIDLEQTLPRLQEALNVCAHIVYRGGMVLFLCRNAQVLPWVEKMAKDVKEFSHCRPWKQGIFTNASHTFNTLPIYPELCVFFNTQDTVFDQHRAVIESSKLLIPSVGIVDSNCTAENVTYVVPSNDDTPTALQLYIRLFGIAVRRAKDKRKADGLDDS